MRLPGERLFPLSGFSNNYPASIYAGMLHLPAPCFNFDLINAFRGTPVIPIVVYFHS